MRIKLGNIFAILVLPVLLLVAAGCGSTSSSGADGTGSMAAKLVFAANAKTAKTVASAPAGVATIRLAVSGPSMSTVQQDFPASAGGATLSGIPAGTGLTLTATGLDANGTATYSGSISGLTVQAGLTTNAGTVTLTPVSGSVFTSAMVSGKTFEFSLGDGSSTPAVGRMAFNAGGSLLTLFTNFQGMFTGQWSVNGSGQLVCTVASTFGANMSAINSISGRVFTFTLTGGGSSPGGPTTLSVSGSYTNPVNPNDLAGTLNGTITASSSNTTATLQSLMASGIYFTDSGSYQSGTSYLTVNAFEKVTGSNGATLASTLYYNVPTSTDWSTTLPSGAPTDLFSRTRLYLTSTGWQSGPDGPTALSAAFNADGTVTLTNSVDGSTSKIGSASLDVSGLAIGIGAPDTAWIPNINGTALLPAGSLLMALNFTQLTDSYVLNLNETVYGATSLSQVPTLAGSAYLDTTGDISCYATFNTTGSSVSIYLAPNGGGTSPILIGTGTYATSTVSGQQILEVQIPSTLRAQYQLGDNPIFAVVNGQVLRGQHKAANTFSYTDGGLNVNATAANFIMQNTLSTGSVTASW